MIAGIPALRTLITCREIPFFASVQRTAHPCTLFGDGLFLLLLRNSSIICNQRTTICGLLIATLRRRTALPLGVRLSRILIFFGHFFSSVVQRVHIACIHSKCSG